MGLFDLLHIRTARWLDGSGTDQLEYPHVVDDEPALVNLAANPVVLPYIVEMIEKPRLKSTWIAFKWRGGRTDLHSNRVTQIELPPTTGR